MLDIDGFRFDKATQVTVDAQAEFGDFVRQCARRFGKNNFFMPGEITGGNTFGSIYLGRGRQPDMLPENLTVAVTLTNASSDKYFIRSPDRNALDAAAFHYSIYRSLTRFLGMDGNLTAGFDVPFDFVNTWNIMLMTNDMINANTGQFDPRHMYGTTNQDVFRWPAIKNGVEKMLLGQFITNLHMPGIPLLLWGEEQAFYVLDSTASNYIFGRQPISSQQAWQDHGCYRLGSTQYYEFPLETGLTGCEDDTVSLDHRDPSHPVRNIIKSMYRLRQQYRVLNDGYLLQSLSNQTHEVILPGSNGTATETGMWSVMRNTFPGVQNFTTGKQPVWLVYQNDNRTVKYSFDCSSNDSSLVALFDAGTTVKNLLAPYEEYALKQGPKKLGIDFSEKFNGCLDQLELEPWAYKAFVPKEAWIAPQPMVTKFSPGHDARILSDGKGTVDIEIQFSEAMDCNQITKNLLITSTTEGGQTAQLDAASVSCSNFTAGKPRYVGEIQSTFSLKAKLSNVNDGIHSIAVRNASTVDGRLTDANDRFLFRIGQADNPIVFPRVANYTDGVLTRDSAKNALTVRHKAAGADKFRYSLNWGSSWSDWADYAGGNTQLANQPWSGTNGQKWSGDHVILQYWSRLAGSSSHVQHADVDKQTPRRFPHLFAHGPFNLFGFDGGLNSAFRLDSDGFWKFHLMTEWPSKLQVNVWGMNPDAQPDQTEVLADITNNSIVNRVLPDALGDNSVNFTTLPPSPFLAFRMELQDSTQRYQLVPAGNRLHQIILYALLWTIPIFTATASVWAYMGAFYKVKFNKIGISALRKKNIFPFLFRSKFQKLDTEEEPEEEQSKMRPLRLSNLYPSSRHSSGMVPTIAVAEKRRTVLIATMEYDIEDWNIKIKIGGLGVMAQLMGKSLTHQDLIWVVPCVGGIDYPVDTLAEPMTITILGNPYEIQVQYHQLKNITYVLLDAPVFRQQTKSEPYPPRMDDLDSAVYYSAWNACIAETIKRFPVDLYHINDYHGAAAPLYLLPQTIPVALSLHNAEFQGLWPMRNAKEREEVCKVYNLDQSIVESYVQFGEVFNLLHAGASYLRIHQKGFGAVGVSNKYGERSYARYPIFWGLKKIGKLPNPDPTDIEPVNAEQEANQVIIVDPSYEAARGDLRKQAQEWAGLNVDPEAELFVFVGRWSTQKGVDLIADVFPAVLEKHPKVQLICVGPVIDLYGKFAALKLGSMMKKYPGRVYSKPEFTALPPYIFSGAEFALIPSRDEPFGLVAVEFGRKGALGVGARVGGLGQMPGWWFTVESTTTKHLQQQFKSAIEDALASKTKVRALMRARAAKQRFPVAKWVHDLNVIQSTAIKIHEEVAASSGHGKLRIRSASAIRDSVIFSRSRDNSMERDSADRLPGHEGASRLRAFSRQSHTDSTDRLSVYESPPSQRRPSMHSRNFSSSSTDGQTLYDPALSRSRHSLATSDSMDRLSTYEDNTPPDLPVLSGFDFGLNRTLSLGVRAGPGHQRPIIRRAGPESPEGWELHESDIEIEDTQAPDEFTISMEEAEASRVAGERNAALRRLDTSGIRHRESSPHPPDDALLVTRGRSRPRGSSSARSSITLRADSPRRGRSMSPNANENLLSTRDTRDLSPSARPMSSVLSLNLVKGDRTDYNLQKVDLNFEDTSGEYYRAFEAKLAKLSAKTSEGDLCIEEYLIDSEKAWFKRMREAKLGRSRANSPDSSDDASVGRPSLDDEFLLGQDYQKPSFVKRLMQRRIGDWPIYSFLLALGQIIAANSYQITLLTGGQAESNTKLYIVGAIYIVTSCIWWIMFRTLKSIYVLSLPFLFYGMAFLFIGVSPFVKLGAGRDWMANVATGLYITASSSGSIFFALNFGDEGKSIYPYLSEHHLQLY